MERKGLEGKIPDCGKVVEVVEMKVDGDDGDADED
jgi:hypothetical protein